MERFADRGIGTIGRLYNNGKVNYHIQDLHYKINDVLFPLAYKPINERAARRAYGRLRDLMVQLKDVKMSLRSTEARDELGKKTKDMCLKLKEIGQNCKESESDIQDIQKVLNFFTHKYIQAKESLTPDKAIKLLEEYRDINQDYVQSSPFKSRLNDKNFQQVKQDLIEFLNCYYGLYA